MASYAANRLTANPVGVMRRKLQHATILTSPVGANARKVGGPSELICVSHTVPLSSGKVSCRALSTSSTVSRHARLSTLSLSNGHLSASSSQAFGTGRTMATTSRPGVNRRDSRLSVSDEIYDAVVVGAGPAGITAVGNLLENQVEKILWVDELFNGGRVNEYYREVPSNTKVKLFIDFATAVAPFKQIVSGAQFGSSSNTSKATGGAEGDNSSDKLHDLRKLDQERGCHLSHAADMCLMLTHGLKQTAGVTARKGRVSEALLDERAGSWSVSLDGESSQPSVQTKRLVLCTGSSPLDPSLPYEPKDLQHIDLDVALSPTRLSALLTSEGQTTVAVIGASHSAVLVLMNLAQLASTTRPDLNVKWFTRHPLRYAEYEDGFIARDNTGLKGEAAVWAKENLEPETMPNSPVSKHLTKIAYEKGHEKQVYEEHMHDCSYVVQAIGYARNPTPTLRVADPGKAIEPRFDHDHGVFEYATESNGDLQRLPGVYGAGIAFPQRVVDKKYGHEEFNVGFFKFMKAVKAWVPEWKAVA